MEKYLWLGNGSWNHGLLSLAIEVYPIVAYSPLFSNADGI
jgi:hypothetical protein